MKLLLTSIGGAGDVSTLIENKTKFSPNIRKLRRDRVQSHIWLTASLYMTKYLCISPYFRKPFLIYDFAPDPLWIFLYIRKIFSSFYHCIVYSWNCCWRAGGAGDVFRTPCPASQVVMTPRRPSRALGQGGLLYGSQESLCPSYLASYDRSRAHQRAPSAPRDLPGS